MKLVFISSSLRDNTYNGIKHNQELAKDYCRFACSQGYACFAPHIFYTQFLNDEDQSQRLIGITAGVEILFRCDELWVFADSDNLISSGMKMEIKAAERYNQTGKRKIIIRYFDTQLKERIKDNADSNAQNWNESDVPSL